MLIHTQKIISLPQELLPGDQTVCVFVARTTQRLKMYLPQCVCRDVLIAFGVCVFCFYGHWLFDLLVGVFLMCVLVFYCVRVFWGLFCFIFGLVGFEHAIST